mgnify:CR=1 FL=1
MLMVHYFSAIITIICVYFAGWNYLWLFPAPLLILSVPLWLIGFKSVYLVEREYFMGTGVLYFGLGILYLITIGLLKIFVMP